MRVERAIGIGLLVFTAVAGFLTTHLSESTMEGEPGPKFFPTLILLLLAVLSLVLAVRGGGEAPAKKEDEFSTREALAYFAVFLTCLAAMYFVGFYISMGVMLAVLTWLTGWKIPKAILFGGVVVLVIYLLFDRLLEISLPIGAFFR